MVGMKLVLATLFITLVVCSSAVAQTYGDHPHMGDMMEYKGAWGLGGMILGPIMMIVFIAVAVVVVVLLLRWLGGSGHGSALYSPPGKTPLGILKERFAKGEIDKEEFEERQRVLDEQRSTAPWRWYFARRSDLPRSPAQAPIIPSARQSVRLAAKRNSLVLGASRAGSMPKRPKIPSPNIVSTAE